MPGTTIGFIGVGHMGTEMVHRLLQADTPLVIHDINPERLEAFKSSKATIAASVADVGKQAKIIFLSLPTPQISRAVVQELAKHPSARIVVDLSTIGPLTAQDNAALLATHDMTYVDAPVSGGVPGARAGTLSIMVSCPAPTYEECVDLLAIMGRPQHVGPEAGQAQILKLINNMMSVTALAITSEAMAMGAKAGIDADVMLAVLDKSSGRNSATADKFPRAVLPGTFDYGFTLGLSHKDLSLCIQEAQAMKVPMAVGSLVFQLLSIAHSVYGPDADFTNLCRLEETWAGAQIRSKSAQAK